MSNIPTDQSGILQLLSLLYGTTRAPELLRRVEILIERHSHAMPAATAGDLSESDALLIVYPDQLRADGEPPLRTLGRFADEYLGGLVNGVHILPFFPSSSDDGFSVTDYTSVDPALGDWAELASLGRRFGLMFDAVINHASVQGDWFQSYLRNEPPFERFFIDVPGHPDLSSVVRPRTTPLLTDFLAPDGRRSVWTTFGPDQADLNYQNPEVLLKVLEILLVYVERGARFIRLDAVGYLWKEAGTPCIHLPQTHALVMLMRSVIGAAAPQVKLLTETNVGQRENLSYLGTDHPEADLAYNFSLPPLLLHAFHTQQATTLTNWAEALPILPESTALLNVLATHDGIGLNGCRDLLSPAEIDQLAHCIEGAGGHISRKTSEGGASDPYELNVNYMDALDAVAARTEGQHSLRRFITAHAIMLALKGMPALYFHSLIGSRGWSEGMKATGRPRTVNRQKLRYTDVRADLMDADSLRARVYLELARLLRLRKTHHSFSPFAPQKVLHASSGVLALLRGEADSGSQLLCIHNVTPLPQAFECSLWKAGCGPSGVVDIITSRGFEFLRGSRFSVPPYGTLWLRIGSGVERSID